MNRFIVLILVAVILVSIVPFPSVKSQTLAGSLILSAGGEILTSAVIDTVHGFGYFGTYTDPGVIIKIRLSDFTFVGALTLDLGEPLLNAGIIDPAAGFAYFGTVTNLVVKIDLTTFTRIRTLNLTELTKMRGSIYTGLIDSVAGFAYFGGWGVGGPGTGRGSAVLAKIRLSNFTLADTLTLNPSKNDLCSALADFGAGYAYFGTTEAYPKPDMIVKVRLSDFSRVDALTLDSGENGLCAAAIDAVGGYAYFGTGQPSVVKIKLSDFSRIGALNLARSDGTPSSAVIDPSAGFAYFGTDALPVSKVVKVRVSDFSLAGVLTLQKEEYWPKSAIIDLSGGFAYFGTSTVPGRIVKVRLSDFSREGVLTLSPAEGQLRAAVIDPQGAFAYFGARGQPPNPGFIVKIRLSDFSRIAALALNQDENVISSGVMDAGGEFAYFGTGLSNLGIPGKIVKVRLSDFSRVDSVEVPEGDPMSAVIDSANGFAYLGVQGSTLHSNPSVIVKIRLSDFTRVGTIALQNESGYFPAVIDLTNGFAYFGGGNAQGANIVKVRLSDFTVVGFLDLRTISGTWSAVIDSKSGYAYFGTSGKPAKYTYFSGPPPCWSCLFKVRLSDFSLIGRLPLTVSVYVDFNTGVIDPVGGFAYFGSLYGNPNQITVIRLSDFTLNESISLPKNDLGLASSVIDNFHGYAYFGTLTQPGIVFRVRLTPSQNSASILSSSSVTTPQYFSQTNSTSGAGQQVPGLSWESIAIGLVVGVLIVIVARKRMRFSSNKRDTH